MPANRPNRPNPAETKKQTKAELRRKIDEEIYKLNQTVIIDRMGTRDELFGDNQDLDNLRKKMEKIETEKLNKKSNQDKKDKKDTGEKELKKFDIKLKLIEREK
jgi:hypothetical protein